MAPERTERELATMRGGASATTPLSDDESESPHEGGSHAAPAESTKTKLLHTGSSACSS